MSADNSNNQNNNQNNNKSFDVKSWLFGIIGTVISSVLIYYLTKEPKKPETTPSPIIVVMPPSDPPKKADESDEKKPPETLIEPYAPTESQVEDKPKHQYPPAEPVDYPPIPVIDKPKETGDFCCNSSGEHLCKATVEPKEIGVPCLCDGIIKEGQICK